MAPVWLDYPHDEMHGRFPRRSLWRAFLLLHAIPRFYLSAGIAKANRFPFRTGCDRLADLDVSCTSRVRRSIPCW